MRNVALLCTTLILALPLRLDAQITLVGNVIHEHAATPGTAHQGTIVVQNTTSELQEAKIYQTDYRFFADGRSLYDAAGSTTRSNAPWVELSSSIVSIPAGQAAQVHYQVTVPAADALQGTYWSVVMVEGVTREPEPVAADRRVALRSTVRYAVQVVTHIGSSGAPSVDFVDPTVGVDADAGRWFEVDLTNAGDRAHRIDVVLELFTEEGAPVRTLRSQRGLVYPGTGIRQRFALGTLPTGRYRALVIADSGADAVFGAEYTLQF